MNGNHWLVLVYCLTNTFIAPSYCLRPMLDSRSRTGGRIRNRCSKIAVPNGSMVLRHRGRVAKFTCNPGYKLIGDNIATCHLQAWDAVPHCVKNVECPKEMPQVLNGYMIEYNYVFFKIVCNVGYKVPLGAQSVYPCEEFFNPEVKPAVCQLTDAMFCDFEKDLCGWNNTVPYFSWILHQNATPSHELHTGPGSDHTTGIGHYLYIETSGLGSDEKYAKLTHRFSKIDTPEICFVFWYHMYGHNIGTLDVYVDFVKVFTKSGNLGDKWRKGIIQKLPSESDFYISLVATTANGFAGDIAIDDIGLVNSTDCTMPLLIDTTCKNRCFAPETNMTVCKCSSECLIEGTCCADFTHVCSADGYKSTTWETTELQSTTESETQPDFPSSEQSSTTVDVDATTELLSVMLDKSGERVTTEVQQETADFTLEVSQSDLYGASTEVPESHLLHSTEDLLAASTIACWDCQDSLIMEVTATSTTTVHSANSTTDSDASKNQSSHSAGSAVSFSSRWDDAATDSLIHTYQGTAQKQMTSDYSVPYPKTHETSVAATEMAAAKAIRQINSTEYGPWTTEPMSETTDARTTSAMASTSKPSTTTSATMLHITEGSTSTTAQITKAETTWDVTDTTTVPIDLSESASHAHLPLGSDDELNYNELKETDEPEETTEHHVQTKPTSTMTTWTTRSLTRNTEKSEVYRWKKTYQPKGRFKFSAVKSESRTTTYVSIMIGVLVFLAAATVAAYIFRKRRTSRFRDSTEESDVLYMTSDDILDLNVARRPTAGQSSSAAPSTSQKGTLSEYSFNLQFNKS